nr:unnamed protein product [Digitaria exilis]
MSGRWAAAAPSLLRVLLALQCGVVFLQCSHASDMSADVSALMAFKRAIIDDPHSVLSDWIDADGNACDWHGVICSPQGSVISLKLSNSSLKGFIAPELGRLSLLQELYLDHNLLFGTIPKLIGSLRNLRVLDLSVNRLTGPIPSELGGLSSVGVINFHSNGLTGNIPTELGKLQNLVELRLDRNRLKGSIPGSNTGSFSPTTNIGSTAHNGLCPSPRLYVGDFSYNFLVGKIPPCLKYLPSRQELEVACEDFSNIIGSSPETVVYKGTMKDGPEVIDLARLNHDNIAKFLGYCRESDPFSRMLVFEYASNGTLFEHLHYGEGAQLSWLRRMKIAIGIAQGLRYLHTELQPPFAISELNSNSVYVTEDFTPKLVDFECWKMMFSKHEKDRRHFNSKASFHGNGDSVEDKHADIQGNTYAFGVILLEIISGRLPYCKDKGFLVDWPPLAKNMDLTGDSDSCTQATKYLQQPEEIGKLVDPELSNVRTEDLAVLCSVVSRCIDPDPSKRPSMQIITGVLENGIDLSAAAILKESSLAWAELALAL